MASRERRTQFEGSFGDSWQERLAYVVDMMREMSAQSDPQEMVKAYGARMRNILPFDATISLSRRGLEHPRVRITRSHLWGSEVNPWRTTEHVIVDRGILSELIWKEQAVIIDDLRVERDDPAFAHLEGMRSLSAMPMFDRGAALNMVLALSRTTGTFNPEVLPERVWMTNLFGRATQNLVLNDQLQSAYDAVDREMKIVADLQRSLLPAELPQIPGLQLAAHYQTSRRAGGDYYDFFPLPDGDWGFLIADVSGHGTPAAVMMAVTHSIAHTCGDPPAPPSSLLKFINHHLAARYTTDRGSFVTAFYGTYNPPTRTITYSSAGHCPPRIKRAVDGEVVVLDQALSLPLGIEPDELYRDAKITLDPGDALVLYTDGITEARKTGSSDLFGEARLDAVIRRCTPDAEMIVRNVLLAVEEFTDSSYPPADDMTLLVARSYPDAR